MVHMSNCLGNKNLGELRLDKDFIEYVVEWLSEEQNLDSPVEWLVENLSGNINRVRRVTLAWEEGKSKSFVVKQVPEDGRLEKFPMIVFPENRLDFEMQWFCEWGRIQQQTSCTVRPPVVYRYDKDRKVILMEDLKSRETLSDYLSTCDDATEVVRELGKFLGLMHGTTLHRFTVENPGAAQNREFVFALPLTNPEMIRTIWAEQDKDGSKKGPMSSDEKVAMQEEFLSRHGSVILPVVMGLKEGFKETSMSVLTHGDLHGDSFLMLGDGKIGVIDAELSDSGAAGFDIGTLAAHIWAVRTSSGSYRNEIERTLSELWGRYVQAFGEMANCPDYALEELAEDSSRQCGAELLRRVLGAASFPFSLTTEVSRQLLSDAQSMLLGNTGLFI